MLESISSAGTSASSHVVGFLGLLLVRDVAKAFRFLVPSHPRFVRTATWAVPMDAVAFTRKEQSDVDADYCCSADGAQVDNHCCLRCRSGTLGERRSRRVTAARLRRLPNLPGATSRVAGRGQADACSPTEVSAI